MLKTCLANIGAQTDMCINQLDQTRIVFMYANVHFDPHTNNFVYESVKRNARISTEHSLDTTLFLMQNGGSDFTDKRSLELDFKGKRIKENGDRQSLGQVAKMLRDCHSTKGLTS